jgi:D-methionine transport system substrate-binding protein
MWRKICALIVSTVLILGLTACHQKEAKNTIRVGTIAGPETQLMEVAKEVALQRYGLNVKIITFSDYNTPNEALANGDLDANAFQHIPYLDAQIKARGYKIVPIAKTFIYPMGIYSKKITKLAELTDGAKVAVANDPSNESRALLLLQAAKLITLKPNAGFNATKLDIASNPKHLQIVALDAAQLPRALSDVTLAVINTNYAIPVGLSPTKDALFVESTHSPYANIIAARADNKDDPRLKQLVSAFQSPEVMAEAKKLFGDGAIAAWK